MTSKLLTFLIISLLSYSTTYSQSWEWIQNNEGGQNEKGNGIAVDDFGNTYVVGEFSQVAVFNTDSLTSYGFSDIFLAKYDFSGNLLWLKRAGGSLFDVGWGITLNDAGEIFITGMFSDTAYFGSDTIIGLDVYNVFLAKYTNQGDVVWVKSSGGIGSNKAGRDIVLDSADNIYVSGYYRGTITFDSITLTTNQLDDMFVVKFDNNGNVLWARNGECTGSAYAYAVAVDNWGNPSVVGNFSDTIVFETDTLISGANSAAFVVKYDSNGNLLWANSSGLNVQNGTTRGYGICADTNANTYITGVFLWSTTFDTVTHTAQYWDSYVTKYNSVGDLVWSKSMTAKSYSNSKKIKSDAFGDLYITGNFTDTLSIGTSTLISTGGSDMFVAKLDENGNTLWVKKAGVEKGNNLAIDNIGNIYVTGEYTESPAVFDTLLLSGNGVNSNFYVAKIDRSCSPPSANFEFSNLPLIVQFNDLSANAMSWQWSFGNGDTSTLQHPNYQYDSSGVYVVCLTITNNCGLFNSYCDTLDITTSLNISEIEVDNSSLIAYPNPFHLETTIEFKENISENYSLIIFNLSGKILRKVVDISSGYKIERLNLPSGFYYVQLLENQNQYGQLKLIVDN